MLSGPLSANFPRTATGDRAWRAAVRAISSVIAHFDPTFRAFDNGSNASWEDCIGGTVCSASGTTRMTYSRSIAALNARPGFLGSAANGTYLASADAVLAQLMHQRMPFTMYVVRALTSLSAQNTFVSVGSTTTAENLFAQTAATTGLQALTRVSIAGGGAAINGVIASTTNACVDVYAYDGTSCALWENGAKSAGLTSNTISPTCDRFVIGARLTGGVYSRSLDGAIGDIIICSAYHSESGRRAVEQLIADRYGWPVIQGMSGFSATKFASLTAGVGVRGASGVGVWSDCLLRLDAAANSTAQFFNVNASSNRGYRLQHLGSTGVAMVGRNGTTSVNGPARAWTSADIGKLSLVGGAADGSFVRSFFNGAELASAVALSGYEPSTTGTQEGLGADAAGGSPATQFSIFGIAGGNVAANATNAAARAAAIKAAGAFVASGGATPSNGWKFDVASGSLADLVGSNAAAITGTLTAAQHIATSWAW